MASCSNKLSDPSIAQNEGSFKTGLSDDLEVRFLGVACFYLSYKGRAVLTDPFATNHRLGKLMFGRVQPDTTLWNSLLTKNQLNNIKMTISGHAHYDHLLALPYLAGQMPTDAVFAGSQTMTNIIAAANPRQKLVSVNNHAGTSQSPGKWVYSTDSLIRIMAFEGGHPPHALGLTLYSGKYETQLKKVPTRFGKWKMGKPLTYLIDFLEKGNQEIGCRVFFGSSGSEPPQGFYPEEIDRQHSPDISILSIATKKEPAIYPGKIIEYTKPEVLFLAHWENFFQPRDKPLKTVQTADVEGVHRFLQSTYGDSIQIILPEPDSDFRIR